jgi:hypothetical protein
MKSSGSRLENREYGRGGSAALTTRHPSIRKSWHQLHRQAAVAQSVYFARGLKPRSYYYWGLLYHASFLSGETNKVHDKTSTDICCVRRFLYTILINKDEFELNVM